MERLTKWNGTKWILPQGRTADGRSNWRLIADKLAEYENLGSPAELKALLRQSQEKKAMTLADKITARRVDFYTWCDIPYLHSTRFDLEWLVENHGVHYTVEEARSDAKAHGCWDYMIVHFEFEG